jgi:hypothetical protein
VRRPARHEALGGCVAALRVALTLWLPQRRSTAACEPAQKIIDVFTCKMRKKLADASNGKNYFETVWGRGYVLRDPAEIEAKVPASTAAPCSIRAGSSSLANILGIAPRAFEPARLLGTHASCPSHRWPAAKGSVGSQPSNLASAKPHLTSSPKMPSGQHIPRHHTPCPDRRSLR